MIDNVVQCKVVLLAASDQLVADLLEHAMPKRNRPNPPTVLKIISLITMVPYNEGYRKLQVTVNRL